MRVHSHLGPGLMESAYEACLEHELVQAGLRARRQVALPVTYRGITIEAGYRLDLLVEERLVVEVKAVTKLLPIHHAQLLTYLRLSRHTVGLLFNFNVTRFKEGFVRLVNAHPGR